MREAGLDTDALLHEADFSFASGDAAARTLLDRPDRGRGIIASSDQMALAVPERAPFSVIEGQQLLRLVHMSRPLRPTAQTSGCRCPKV